MASDQNGDVHMASANTKRQRSLRAVANPSSGQVTHVLAPEAGKDEVDALPEKMRYTVKDVLVVLMSIVSFVVDTGTDIWLAVHFYKSQRMAEFVLTLLFVLVPAVTMTGFSLRWYLNDADQPPDDPDQPRSRPPVPMWKWALRIMCLMLQLGPLLRYFEAMVYGVRSMRAQAHGDKEGHVRNYIYMIYKDADATLLRLFESFMEAAPQLVLQLYILASEHNRHLPADHLNSTLQVVSIASSLFSLAWSLCSYQRSLRYSLPAKNNLSTTATVILFFWHLCSIGARVLAISLCASLFPVYVAIGLLVHWLIMTIWLVIQKTQACYTKCEEALFVVVMGAVHIFTFFNVKDETTRPKYAFFYGLCAVENAVMIIFWYLNADSSLWWYHPGLAVEIALFVFALLFMVIYYWQLHPSRGIKEPSGICVTGQVCRDATLAEKYGVYLEEWAGNSGRPNSRIGTPVTSRSPATSPRTSRARFPSGVSSKASSDGTPLRSRSPSPLLEDPRERRSNEGAPSSSINDSAPSLQRETESSLKDEIGRENELESSSSHQQGNDAVGQSGRRSPSTREKQFRKSESPPPVRRKSRESRDESPQEFIPNRSSSPVDI